MKAFSSSSSSSSAPSPPACSTHAAFSLVDVIPDVGDRCTSLTYSGESVYVGTAGGRVLAFVGGSRVASADAGAGGRRGAGAVSQLEAVPDTGTLLALCDGALVLLELDGLARRPAGLLGDARGVVSFCLNARGFLARHRLCVATATGSKRRLRLYEWAESGGGGGGAYAFVKELDLPDVPRAMAYVAGRLFLGYAREYNILFDETGDVQDALAALGRDTRPLVKYLPGDRLLLVTAADLGVVVDGATGEPAAGVPALSFGHHPLALAYCYPYLLSVSDTSATLEVHSTRSTAPGRSVDQIVQTLDVPLGAVGASARGGGRAPLPCCARTSSSARTTPPPLPPLSARRRPRGLQLPHRARLL